LLASHGSPPQSREMWPSPKMGNAARRGTDYLPRSGITWIEIGGGCSAAHGKQQDRRTLHAHRGNGCARGGFVHEHATQESRYPQDARRPRAPRLPLADRRAAERGFPFLRPAASPRPSVLRAPLGHGLPAVQAAPCAAAAPAGPRPAPSRPRQGGVSGYPSRSRGAERGPVGHGRPADGAGHRRPRRWPRSAPPGRVGRGAAASRVRVTSPARAPPPHRAWPAAPGRVTRRA
jgi:hypothetical protein